MVLRMYVYIYTHTRLDHLVPLFQLIIIRSLQQQQQQKEKKENSVGPAQAMEGIKSEKGWRS